MKNALLPMLLLSLSGCGSKPDVTGVASCDDHAKVDGVCPGVAGGAITTDGIACTSSVDATPADVDAKVAGAAAGTCVMLSAASFLAVNLPAGVNLIGKGSTSTTVAGIKVTGGAAATIRGLKVEGAAISVSGSGALTVDRVHVINAGKVPSIVAIDTSLTVTSSTIELGGGFGIAASCKTACDTARPSLAIRRVLVRDTKSVGIWAHGVNATFDGVQVSSTRADNFLYGRGFEIAENSTLKATRIASLNNQDVGIYIDSSSAELTGFAASGNVRGVQLQAIPRAGAKLDDFVVDDNAALGIGITKASLGIIVQGGRVARTKALKVFVDVGGLQEVGDGINWLDGSEVSILSSVKIESSARRGAIIEASSSGKFEGVLGGGDETRGIIVQGGLEPAMPASLSVAPGVKSEVLTKGMSLAVAATMAAAKAP